jgi:uncharacterized DUF497 family protein
MATARFDWNPIKDRENELKHGVGFAQAQLAFADPHCVIAEDLEHSEDEPRFFCFGRVGGRHPYRSLHLSIRQYPNSWSRLLAKGQTHL